ncbi:DEAD/DEAH box helicase family protein [Paenibacillus macerans]|uniref:DEAD/DEAH box helicase n=1 Tax=Paenibacillus macerans TaxID=44252 RepID=UPI002E2250FB|nr:DEAD/DEAH box helicase family protein [Paenibacillus macerans]MED4954458.1 DEAD/DEAH box helicase family protein [Paenibacillus macerans]
MNNNYFIESIPNIESNDNLREPQLDAYKAVYDHFTIQGNKEHAIIVLPTGVGKTGVMGLIPFGNALGRVLIITPQLVIKDAVLDSLDPEHPKNFWILRNIFNKFNDLPAVIEYSSETPKWALDEANIVILNIHKLQERLEKALSKKVPPDYFDMIIIDEAHHSTAPTWEKALSYFSYAKVVKLTGTPFRSDGENIEGKYVFKYPLSKAMAKGYIKSLERVKYVPDKLYLTLDRNDNILYSIDQIREMGLKDEDWISRSVAYSKDCSLKVVSESVEILKEKRKTGLPHKIIAVACSIYHAEQLVSLYEDFGMGVALVHSKLQPAQLGAALSAIENHKVEVVIHVAKLGEGYDHKYLSVAAIFRPFRQRLPYEQFVGRVLRAIDPEEVVNNEDNIASVVHHHELNLDDLWEFYKKEQEKSEVIKFNERESSSLLDGNVTDRIINKQTGHVQEDGDGEFITDNFINTQLLEERERRIAEEREKLQKLKEVLPNYPEDVLLQMVRREEEGTPSEKILRPDKFIYRKKRNLDDRIKDEMVPELIIKYNIRKEDKDLNKSRLFKKYPWIPDSDKHNAAMMAMYLEQRVNESVGNSKRETWGQQEYEAAMRYVEDIYKVMDQILESELGGNLNDRDS